MKWVVHVRRRHLHPRSTDLWGGSHACKDRLLAKTEKGSGARAWRGAKGQGRTRARYLAGREGDGAGLEQARKAAGKPPAHLGRIAGGSSMWPTAVLVSSIRLVVTGEPDWSSTWVARGNLTTPLVGEEGGCLAKPLRYGHEQLPLRPSRVRSASLAAIHGRCSLISAEARLRPRSEACRSIVHPVPLSTTPADTSSRSGGGGGGGSEGTSTRTCEVGCWLDKHEPAFLCTALLLGVLEES